MIQTVNPSTGENLQTYDWDDLQECERKILLASDEFSRWKRSAFDERSRLLINIQSRLLAEKLRLARLMMEEMGKPITQAQAEIEKCARLCGFFAENAGAWLQEESRTWGAGRNARVRHEPLGVILGIMPWNFPFWQVFRFAVPTIFAGNTVLIKHADITTGVSLAIEQLFLDASAPEGVLQAVKADHPTTAEIIARASVRGVSLTGSERAGTEVASLAGRSLKKSVLELGGSDPYIVLADADLELAVRTCAEARLMNTGQSCIAAKRFIVEAPVYEKFREMIVMNFSTKVMGNPSDEKTDLGPMARRDLRDNLHNQVQRSVQMGARTLLGGEVPSSKGFFYPPTVLENVHADQPAFHEEIFGPVATLFRVTSLDEALRLANQTRYGLGAAIFTRNQELALKVARGDIYSGLCAINLPVQSTPELPFGGVGISGYGRELGREGMLEFTNTKTIIF